MNPRIPAEFTPEHYARGIVGAARTNDPNSANSQFFVMFADGGFLMASTRCGARSTRRA